MDMPDPYADYEAVKRTWIPQMHRRSVADSQIFSEQYNTPGNFRLGKETRDLEFLPQMQPQNLDEDEEYEVPTNGNFLARDADVDLAEQLDIDPEDMRNVLDSGKYAKFLWLLNRFDENERRKDIEVEELINEVPERFTRTYNTPDNFRAGWESRDLSLLEEESPPEPRIYYDEVESENYQPDEYGSGLPKESNEIFRELKNARRFYDEEDDGTYYNAPVNVYGSPNGYPIKSVEYEEVRNVPRELVRHDNKLESGTYTEGGVVYGPNPRAAGKVKGD